VTVLLGLVAYVGLTGNSGTVNLHVELTRHITEKGSCVAETVLIMRSFEGCMCFQRKYSAYYASAASRRISMDGASQETTLEAHWLASAPYTLMYGWHLLNDNRDIRTVQSHQLLFVDRPRR
jgi:hypothetical protein